MMAVIGFPSSTQQVYQMEFAPKIQHYLLGGCGKQVINTQDTILLLALANL